MYSIRDSDSGSDLDLHRVLDLWHRDLNIELGLLWGLDLEVLFRFWILDLHLDSKLVMGSECKLDLEWDSGFRLKISIVLWNLDLEFYLDSTFGLTLGFGFGLRGGFVVASVCKSIIQHPISQIPVQGLIQFHN